MLHHLNNITDLPTISNEKRQQLWEDLQDNLDDGALFECMECGEVYFGSHIRCFECNSPRIRYVRGEK